MVTNIKTNAEARKVVFAHIEKYSSSMKVPKRLMEKCICGRNLTKDDLKCLSIIRRNLTRQVGRIIDDKYISIFYECENTVGNFWESKKDEIDSIISRDCDKYCSRFLNKDDMTSTRCLNEFASSIRYEIGQREMLNRSAKESIGKLMSYCDMFKRLVELGLLHTPYINGLKSCNKAKVDNAVKTFKVPVELRLKRMTDEFIDYAKGINDDYAEKLFFRIRAQFMCCLQRKYSDIRDYLRNNGETIEEQVQEVTEDKTVDRKKYLDNYKDLNTLAEENGFVYNRSHGDHGIFINTEGFVVVIPQGRKVGKGLSLAIQKYILGEKESRWNSSVEE